MDNCWHQVGDGYYMRGMLILKLKDCVNAYMTLVGRRVLCPVVIVRVTLGGFDNCHLVTNTIVW
jgi:hypothetical protein